MELCAAADVSAGMNWPFIWDTNPAAFARLDFLHIPDELLSQEYLPEFIYSGKYVLETLQSGISFVYSVKKHLSQLFPWKGVLSMLNNHTNPVIDCLITRRSCRAYSDRKVDLATLQEILHAGTFAPSGRGAQSVTFVAIQNASLIEELERKNAEVLGTPGAHPFYGAGTVIVVLADPQRPTCVEDGALAMGNLMNAAHALGVDSCWIHRARQVFALPQWQEWLRSIGVEGEYEGIGHLAIGYADGPLPAARPRKAGRVFYVGPNGDNK